MQITEPSKSVASPRKGSLRDSLRAREGSPGLAPLSSLAHPAGTRRGRRAEERETGEVFGGGPREGGAQEGGGPAEEDLGLDAAIGWPAPRRPLPRCPSPRLLRPPSSSRPRQPRLLEQPAERLRSLCLGAAGRRGPAQAGHAGTEEAQRTGSDGETGEELASVTITITTITISISISITDRRPSQLPQPPLPSHPCVTPTLSDYFLFMGGTLKKRQSASH
ncbi:uncharacterized protein LOC124239612 [Equus quagga]|uniref:uncharacterized protein LOC124239612 n=1 Tax=Equus quagga TaxID=89248 RepID=UPI001EE1895B|nr:uncharacterized protein LOC124239612 [Equus quagga]